MADREAQITVSAVGEIQVVPDRLRFAIGVDVARPRPGKALEALSVRVRSLQGVLDAMAVSPGDRRTSELSLRPEQGTRPDEWMHHAASSFEVVVDDFDTAAEILAQAADAIGDALTVGGLQWMVTDPEESLRAARRRAVMTATATATELAAAAGAQLGRLRSIHEPPPGRPATTTRLATASHGGSAALEAGQSRVAVSVEMTWMLE